MISCVSEPLRSELFELAKKYPQLQEVYKTLEDIRIEEKMNQEYGDFSTERNKGITLNNSIYDIDNWAPLTQYYKNYIVNYNGLYYYSANDQTSGSNFITDLNNGLWNGWTYDRGQSIPIFVWKPSYKFSNENKPRIKKI